MEAGGEIGGEERPDGQGAEEVRAAGEATGMTSRGEEEVESVGEAKRPEKGNGAEEEEGR